MRPTLALVLSVTLLTSACASAGGGRLHPTALENVQRGPRQPPSTSAATARVDPALLVSYITQLRIGSRVRVSLDGGRRLSGTLMKADDQGLVIQPRTRVPEPPVQIALDSILAVELETNSNVGKTVGAAIAGGVGGALAFFLVMAAIFSGD